MSETHYKRNRALEEAFIGVIGPAFIGFHGSITFDVHNGTCPAVRINESVKLNQKRKCQPHQQ